MSSFFRRKDDKNKHAKKAAHNSDDDFDEILDVDEVLNEEKKIDLPDAEYRRREWPGGYCFQVEVVETHRKFPGGDFGPRRLPTDRPLMATIDGKVERKLNDVTKELPLKYCEWVTPWEVYQGTDPRDHYVNSGGGALMASLTGNKDESKIELLSRFDLAGWEYAPDFPREFHPKPTKMKDWVRRRFWRRVFVAKVSIDVHIPFPEDFRIIMQSSLVKKNEYLDHIKMLSQNRRASITMETEQSEQRQDQERKRLEIQKKLEAEVRKQEEKEASRKQNKDKLMNALGHVGSGIFTSKSSEFTPEAVEEPEASTFLECPGSGFRVVDGDEGYDEGEGYGIPSPAVAPNAEDPDRFSQLFRIENAKRRQLASDRRVFLEETASTYISERFHVAAAVARAAEEQQRLEQLAKEQELLDAKDPAKAAALRASTRTDAATPMGSEANFASSASTVWGSDDEDVTDPDKRDDEYRDRDWPVGFSFMVELMESQRYFPVGGWSHKRLISDPVKYPFTTEDGKIKRSLNKVTKELPSTHAEWVTPWEVYFGTDLSDLYKGDSELSRFDEDGWEYAPSFRFGSYKNRQSMGTWVRRRFWRRVFVATVGLKVQIPFPENFKAIMGKALVKESEYNESVKMLRRNRIATKTKQQEDQKNLSTSGKSLQKSGSSSLFGGGKSSEALDNMSPRAEDTAALSLLHALDEEGTTYDDTVNWSNTTTLLVEVVETQRKWPLRGWTDGRLGTDRPAFATQDGLISRPLAVVDSELPSPNCVWVSPWQIYIGSGNDRGRFDEDGWEYAIDFPAKHVRHPSFLHVVRRRFWRRVFAVVIDDGKFEYPNALNKVMTPFKISKNAYAVSVQHPTNVQLARKNAPGGGLLGLIGGGMLRRTDSQSSMGASSFASTVFDPTDCDRYIDVAWTKNRTFKVRVVETQRRFPFSGWSDRRLPTDRWAFANEEGTRERKLADVTQDLPRETCQWITPWQIVVDPNPEDVAALIEDDPTSSDVQELQQRVSTLYFDEDGWEYAVDFPREFNRVFHSVTHWVRRRFWERVFHISDTSIDVSTKVLAGERNSIRVEDDANPKLEEVSAKKSAACRMSLTHRFAGVSLSSTHALASTNGPGSMNTTATNDATVANLDDTVVLIPDGVEFPDEFENIIRRLDESKMVFYTNHKKLEGEDLARKNDGGGGFGKFLGGFLATKETLKMGANGFKNALGALAEVGSPTSPFSPGAIPMGSLHGEELSLEEHTKRKEIFTEVSNYLQKVEDTFLDGLAEATARQARREIREKDRRRRQVLDKNSYSPDGRKGSLIVTIREGRKLYKTPSEVGTPLEIYLTCEYRDKTVGESPNFTTEDRSPKIDTPFPLWVSDDRSTVEINVFVRTGITGGGELKWRTGINLSRPLTNVVRTVDEETLTFVEEGLVELPLLNYVPSGGILQSAETLFPFLAAATTWSEAKSEDVSDAAATSGFKGDRPSLIVGWKFEIREDDPAANVGFCPVCARLQGNCLCTGATKAAMLKSQKLNKARRRRDEFIAQKAREKRESDSHEKRDVVDLRIARLTSERECYQKLLDTFRVARSELSKIMINMQNDVLVVRLFNLLKSYAYAQDFRRAVGARVLSHPAMLPCQHQGWLKPDAIRLKRAFLTWTFFQNRRKSMAEIERMRELKQMINDAQTSGARTIEAEVDAGLRLLFDREEEYLSGRRSVRDEMAKALNLSPQQLLEMKWATSAKESKTAETKTMKSNSCCVLQ